MIEEVYIEMSDKGILQQRFKVRTIVKKIPLTFDFCVVHFARQVYTKKSVHGEESK